MLTSHEVGGSCGCRSFCTASPPPTRRRKVWKHGILEAKSDAGFIAMVDKGGFAAKRGLKVELLQIKAGATLMKALISGEIDSVDMGAAESIVAGVRGTGVKIVGCTWPGVPQVVLARADIKAWPISRERPSPFPRPDRCPTCCSAECWMPPTFHSPTSSWQRRAPISIAISRWSPALPMPRWCRTSSKR